MFVVGFMCLLLCCYRYVDGTLDSTVLLTDHDNASTDSSSVIANSLNDPTNPTPNLAVTDDDMLDGGGSVSGTGVGKRKALAIQFSVEHSGKGSLEQSENLKGKLGSKVVPMSDNHSETQSLQSKSSVAMFHKLNENGKGYEEHSLVLLRHILIFVSMVVCGMSIASMTMSKDVIGKGVSGVITTALEGERQTYQQGVAYWAQMLVTNATGGQMRLGFNDINQEMSNSLNIFVSATNELMLDHPPDSTDLVDLSLVSLIDCVGVGC